MLVLKVSERWRVQRVQFSSSVCESLFSGVSVMVLRSRFIITGSLRFVIGLLKHISSEDFGSKLQSVLIASISVPYAFRL